MSTDAASDGIVRSSMDATVGETARKRSLSPDSDTDVEDFMKRPRLTATLSVSSLAETTYSEMPSFSQSSPRTNRTWASRLRESTRTQRPRLLSASSSYSDLSAVRSVTDDVISSGLAMMRSASVASSLDFRSSSPMVQTFSETSAKHHMKPTKTTIDFSVASGLDAATTWPVGWSTDNTIVFGRGNRVYTKSLTTAEDVAQLCKIKDTQGDLQLISCAGKEHPHIVAVATSKGYFQVWDTNAKKVIAHRKTNGILAMSWNGHTFTIGGPKGTIRMYDIRATGADGKLKEATKKLTRHQAGITSLAWNRDGKILASGDKTGTVLCWDDRMTAPLDVGELIQRRKKMQHEGPITALAWSPWQSKIFASGDSAADLTGTIRIWNVNASTIHNTPDKIELDAAVTSIHFTEHCKEIVSTHGPGKPTPIPPTRNDNFDVVNHDPIPSKFSNSLVVHSYPSLRHVVTLKAASTNIAGSLLSPNGYRVMLAVPEESKLKLWDVWGKPMLKRTPSVLSYDGRIR